MIEVEHGQQQCIAMLLPLSDFVIQSFAPGRAVGQGGQGVDQGLLALFFQMLAVAQRFLFHMRHAFGQTLKAGRDLLLALVALLLVLIHGSQQTFQVVLQHELEIVEVGCFLHATLQAVDLFADLRVHLSRRRKVVGVAIAGRLQVALERLQAFVELL
ncbi:hypothetical protein D3C73_1074790 [compost metagenome]